MSDFRVQCCFCGNEIQSQRDAVTLTMTLKKEGSQTIWAHANCLRIHLHESVPIDLAGQDEVPNEN